MEEAAAGVVRVLEGKASYGSRSAAVGREGP
jgi:hypothetical protein